jgi:hypothetical protein
MVQLLGKRAEMDVSQPFSEAIEKIVCQRHAAVHLPSVSDVEAKARFRQFPKGPFELLAGSPLVLASIHVLKQKLKSQRPIQAKVLHRVGVHYDRVSEARQLVKRKDQPLLVHMAALRGAVDADVAKGQVGGLVQILSKRRQLVLRESRELYRGGETPQASAT